MTVAAKEQLDIYARAIARGVDVRTLPAQIRHYIDGERWVIDARSLSLDAGGKRVSFHAFALRQEKDFEVALGEVATNPKWRTEKEWQGRAKKI